MMRLLIHKTLLTGGAIILVVIAAMAVILANNWSTAAVVNHFANDLVPQVNTSGDFNTMLTAAISHAKTFARSRKPGDRDELSAYLAQVQQAVDKLDELKVDDHGLDAVLADDRMLQQQKRVELLASTTAAVDDLQQAIASANDQAIGSALDRLSATEDQVEGLEDSVDDLTSRAAALASDAAQNDIARGNTTAWLVLGILLIVMIASIAAVRYWIVRPIGRLAAAAATIAQGQLDSNVAVTSADEIGDLQQTFNQMVAALRAARAAVDAQQHILETRVAERTADLQRALDELREASAMQEQLRTTILEVSSPVVPVLDGILVMPMIGAIDSARASHIITSMLRAIEQHHAGTIILDATGVPIIDTAVAHTLIQAADAARLLGTHTILVGLRPELAQTIVSLGVNLSRLVTCADLQSGVGYAMEMQRVR